MDHNMDLQQAIYSFLKTQIRFGVYRFGDHLPIMEEASQGFLVSIDTVRSAYARLRREGYITLSKSVGATVKVRYSQEEIDDSKRTYFAARREALTDLSRSMGPLFGQAQWLSLKNASPDTLNEIETLAARNDVRPAYMMIRHLHQIYGVLGNDLLLRLVWQEFILFQAPFLSVPENQVFLEEDQNPLLHMTALCRIRNWAGLRTAVEAFGERLCTAVDRFYEAAAPLPDAGPSVSFIWNSYKKSSQVCYTLGMELLLAMNREIYPSGSLLPSLHRLAEEQRVSVSTVRRTLDLLNSIGATASINGVGTRVLSLDEITENCDFSNPIVRNRLLDCAQSLQILALSCRGVAGVTLPEADEAAIRRGIGQLAELKRLRRPEAAAYEMLVFLSETVPLKAVRTVYAELIRHLFWGYPLRSLFSGEAALAAFYNPIIEGLIAALESRDTERFSSKVEELTAYELNRTMDFLIHLGIREAAALKWRAGEDEPECGRVG